MKVILVWFIITCSILISISCVSAPPPPKQDYSDSDEKAREQELPDEMEISGGGQSPSLGGAMTQAKIEAVRKGVIEIIGDSKENSEKDKLSEVLYNSKHVSKYVEMIERTRKDKIGDDYIYEGRYTVKLKAIGNTLKAHGIIGEGPITKIDVEKVVAEEMEDEPLKDEEIYEELTRKEEIFVKQYIDKISNLVFFSEDIDEDLDNIKGAITIANDYLISNGRTAIDFETAKKLKEDNITIYEEETGGEISITQWIAQKLNADVYIELYGKTEGKTEIGGKHYGTANVQMKAYESSTGELVGSVAYNQLDMKASFSKISQKAARLSAIQGVVYSKIMPQLFKQINENMVNKISKMGIRYEVIIQSPPNDRVMSKLWKKMVREIKSYDLVYQTEEEIKYNVYMIGNVEDVKNVFYDASESVSGLEEMYAVLVRGKTITFNSGL